MWVGHAQFCGASCSNIDSELWGHGHYSVCCSDASKHKEHKGTASCTKNQNG